MTTFALWAAIGAAVIVGFTLGVWLRPFLFPTVLPISEIAKYMEAAVNREEAEVQRHLNAAKLQRSKRRTMRVDGGDPAKVYKRRKRRNKIRRPLDIKP